MMCDGFRQGRKGKGKGKRGEGETWEMGFVFFLGQFVKYNFYFIFWHVTRHFSSKVKHFVNKNT